MNKQMKELKVLNPSQLKKNFSPFTSHISHKRKAFTLAEVLITLGIIGVVAALTLPVLIQKYQEQETIARLRKAYSTLSQAYLFAKNDYGDITEWEQPQADIFAKYIKNVKKCETHCYFLNAKNLNGQEDNYRVFYDLVINDGTYVGFSWHFIPPYETDYNANKGGNANMFTNYSIIIKTDAKNVRFGINTFIFFITKNKIVPYGVVGWEKNLYCDPTKDTSRPNSDWINGQSCAGHIITNGNMDYMKCLRGNQEFCKAY